MCPSRFRKNVEEKERAKGFKDVWDVNDWNDSVVPIKDKDDKSRGIEILMTDDFAKINL